MCRKQSLKRKQVMSITLPSRHCKDKVLVKGTCKLQSIVKKTCELCFETRVIWNCTVISQKPIFEFSQRYEDAAWRTDFL